MIIPTITDNRNHGPDLSLSEQAKVIHRALKYAKDSGSSIPNTRKFLGRALGLSVEAVEALEPYDARVTFTVECDTKDLDGAEFLRLLSSSKEHTLRSLSVSIEDIPKKAPRATKKRG